MKTRSGGKFGTKHCTLTDAGAIIADIASKCEHVTRVIHGVITVPRGSSGSSRKVKIQLVGHALKVSVVAGASHQELFIYATDKMAAQEYIRAGAKEKNFKVSTN
ncbi:MAG: DUF2103 domain-containing protein [Candidatus Kaiserbacteria bacterium]|nr:DUF2103 domain-containing protein [Candidatus Kaiserbacteria bacterium]